jgi:hypothetical protein
LLVEGSLELVPAQEAACDEQHAQRAPRDRCRSHPLSIGAKPSGLKGLCQ